MSMNLAAALVAALITTAPSIASAQNGPSWATLKTYTGTVVQVDAAARRVTTRSNAGDTSVFEAPPSMPSAQLTGFAPGDEVTVTFYDGFEARKRAAGAPPLATSVDPATGQRTATVTVEAIDPVARVLTFTGPRGTYKRTAGENVDAALIRSIAIGEKIDLTYIEYIVSMTHRAPTTATPEAPPAAPSAPEHRMSAYFLYGVDNSFTGKMIQAATGKTTTGVPINLDETTYDEVYGRLGLITAGVSYRMSPRMEAIADFVYSNSSANFEATQIGTAGTSPQVPLKVNFTNYRYVGVEVGQRFFFAQHGRVTPFAGWLVGVNRNQDIRGIFVGVPASVTPGLAAQDGKFFERSWAFSVAPRGGVLIAAGPIDVVAETQLRFLGGLSDVDWLVEEGLRDINKQSERWSVPFLGGVRFRF